MRLMILGLVLAACGTRLPLKRTAPPPALWCFTATVDYREGSFMLGCGNTEALCRRALRTAQSFRGFANVKNLGPCESWAAHDPDGALGASVTQPGGKR